MAQKILDKTEEIELQLQEAERAWEDLPRVEREIDTWDQTEAVVLIEEWPLQESRIGILTSQRESMTGPQRIRLDSLLETVSENRTIVQRLIET